MSADIPKPNHSGVRPPISWQKPAGDSRDEPASLRESVPEPDAGERERIKRAMFAATCRLCNRSERDGAGVIIGGQCMDCVEAWSRGA